MKKFDPNTLQEFDKIIVRCSNKDIWSCDLFSYTFGGNLTVTCLGGRDFKQCVPYNDDTKHLIGTNEKAPEYYRYWEG